MSQSFYDRDFDRNAANFQPLTPLAFLERAAHVFPDRLAIAHGALRRNYRDFHARGKKLASALAKRGIVRGDTVAVTLANTPPMPWSISVKAGTHVCLRQVRAKALYDMIAEHKVTHLCGAPIVMSVLLNARPDERKPLPQRVSFFTAAASPPAAVLKAMGEAGFEVTHLYGLTEVYGPAVVNDWKEEWNALDAHSQAHPKARPARTPHGASIAANPPGHASPQAIESQGAIGRSRRTGSVPRSYTSSGRRPLVTLWSAMRHRHRAFSKPREKGTGGENLLHRSRGRSVRAPGGSARCGRGAPGREMG